MSQYGYALFIKVKLSAVSSPFLRQTLAKGLGDPITGLYATNASAPLKNEAGIRQLYKFGLYSYCGYLNNTAGTCTNTTIANKYQPYDALLADMSLNYSALTIFIINGTSSFESPLIATHTHSAYYLILIGTICAFLALVMCAAFSFLLAQLLTIALSSGVVKHTLAFLISSCLAIVATVLVLTAASIWTSAINSSESVNALILNTTNIPLGIKVSSGEGLSLLWAAVGCLFASLIPYLIRYGFSFLLCIKEAT
jgi:1,3-beta-glucanosyltransferase GAS1